VELLEYHNFEEAYQEIGKFLDDVYTKRIHSSLGYLTPTEFENQWKECKKSKGEIENVMT
jgi:transposase InsO family protein